MRPLDKPAIHLPKLSFVIITFNEESNLERCLRSLPKGFETVLVDSGSTDRTIAIAEAFAAQVHQRPFKDYSDQKNFASDQANAEWVFSLDADEELSDELRRFLLEDFAKTVAASPDISAFRIRRQLIFLGRRLKHGRSSDRPMKLFKREHCRFVGAIHESLKLSQGRTSRLDAGPIRHYSYRDLDDYFRKFNRYTSLMASERFARTERVSLLNLIVRPWWEFFYRFFLRAGCLDGYPGYTYALISSLYAYIKYAKLYELQARSHSSHG